MKLRSNILPGMLVSPKILNKSPRRRHLDSRTRTPQHPRTRFMMRRQVVARRQRYTIQKIRSGCKESVKLFRFIVTSMREIHILRCRQPTDGVRMHELSWCVIFIEKEFLNTLSQCGRSTSLTVPIKVNFTDLLSGFRLKKTDDFFERRPLFWVYSAAPHDQVVDGWRGVYNRVFCGHWTPPLLDHRSDQSHWLFRRLRFLERHTIALTQQV
mmetsp:Transcript_21278/g.27663  ORF Transcript_21278/g.27663 Transcript_21278/m.27663 type:complete len:212 (+) Transcript_21278:83-718(+)